MQAWRVAWLQSRPQPLLQQLAEGHHRCMCCLRTAKQGWRLSVHALHVQDGAAAALASTDEHAKAQHQALIDACKAGDLAAVQALIAAGADVKVWPSSARTPRMSCCGTMDSERELPDVL